MARNSFPIWKPQKFNLEFILISLDRKKAFKKFRNSCSGFIKKSTVRNVIFKKNNYKCVLCNSLKDLQVDHIKSVISCFNEGLFFFCNTEVNLQTLCQTCNASKTP